MKHALCALFGKSQKCALRHFFQSFFERYMNQLKVTMDHKAIEIN
jgi:hypothetical protein